MTVNSSSARFVLFKTLMHKSPAVNNNRDTDWVVGSVSVHGDKHRTFKGCCKISLQLQVIDWFIFVKAGSLWSLLYRVWAHYKGLDEWHPVKPDLLVKHKKSNVSKRILWRLYAVNTTVIVAGSFPLRSLMSKAKIEGNRSCGGMLLV